MSEEMIERHQGDEMIRLTLMDGQVRVMMCETTQMAQRAADIHGATPVCTAAMGRLMTATSMLTALLEVINIQSHEYDPVDLQKVQDTLNQVYDRFVAKYGAINSKGNIFAFSDDDQFPLLRSIEDERKDTSCCH